MIFNFITLEETQNANGGFTPMLLMIGVLVVMWILMMRPQRKREKQEREFRQNMKAGDRVMFSGGIYGKVRNIEDHTVDIEVSNGVVMTVEKSMVTPVPSADEKK